MRERQQTVELDREPAIWRRQKNGAARDARELCDEFVLILGAADVLEHGARVNDVEARVCERQPTAVRATVSQTRVQLLQE